MQAERVEGPGGEARWRLSDVIGAEEGLGVECLSGSGAIASAYNRAFAEVCAALPLCATLPGAACAANDGRELLVRSKSAMSIVQRKEQNAH